MLPSNGAISTPTVKEVAPKACYCYNFMVGLCAETESQLESSAYRTACATILDFSGGSSL